MRTFTEAIVCLASVSIASAGSDTDACLNGTCGQKGEPEDDPVALMQRRVTVVEENLAHDKVPSKMPRIVMKQNSTHQKSGNLVDRTDLEARVKAMKERLAKRRAGATDVKQKKKANNSNVLPGMIMKENSTQNKSGNLINRTDLEARVKAMKERLAERKARNKDMKQKKIANKSHMALMKMNESRHKRSQRALLNSRAGVGIFGSRRRRRRLFKAITKTVKDVGKVFSDASKIVKKTYNSVRETAVDTILDTVNVVAAWTANTWDMMKEAVAALAEAAVEFAVDVWNALTDWFSCIDFKELMINLMFGNGPGIDASESDLDITLSSNPSMSATLVPTLGSGGYEYETSNAGTFSASGSELSWSYEESPEEGITMSAGASLVFVPALTLAVEPVAGNVILEFEGSVMLTIEASVEAEKSFEYNRQEAYPKVPKSYTACVPVFCISLTLQGVVELDVIVEVAGAASASITVEYSVGGSVSLHIPSGDTDASINAGTLEHQETLEYESSFKGLMSIKAGPVFTVLPTPGAPISLEPFVRAELNAYAQAVTGEDPCGKAAINVYADPAVEALGLPEAIELDSSIIEEGIITAIVEMPTNLLTTILDMLGGCWIPGLSALEDALEAVLQAMADVIEAAIPDFNIDFGDPVGLFRKSICYNVYTVTLPSGSSCGEYEVGCGSGASAALIDYDTSPSEGCPAFQGGYNYPYNDVTSGSGIADAAACSVYCLERDAPYFVYDSGGGGNCWCKSKLENKATCATGDAVNAVWAGNGRQYSAVIHTINGGTITVNWDDGDTTHRVCDTDEVFKNNVACSNLQAANSAYSSGISCQDGHMLIEFYLLKETADCKPAGDWLYMNDHAETAADCAAKCKSGDYNAEKFVWVKHGDKNCKCAPDTCTMNTWSLGAVYQYGEVFPGYDYIGCFQDNVVTRKSFMVDKDDRGIQLCRDECFGGGYDYFGFECPQSSGVHCECGIGMASTPDARPVELPRFTYSHKGYWDNPKNLGSTKTDEDCATLCNEHESCDGFSRKISSVSQTCWGYGTDSLWQDQGGTRTSWTVNPSHDGKPTEDFAYRKEMGISATKGLVTAPFLIVQDYVHSPGELATGGTAYGAEIKLLMRCKSDSSVTFRAEVLAPDGNTDSFNIQVDEQSVQTWHTGHVWTWGWSVASPSFDVSQGWHVVKVLGREDGIKVRQLKVESGHGPCSLEELQFLGCYVDDGERSFEGGYVSVGRNAATVDNCRFHCQGKQFMAIQNGDQCRCGDTYDGAEPYIKVADSECDGHNTNSCSVDHGCGATWRNSIYKVGQAKFTKLFDNCARTKSGGTPAGATSHGDMTFQQCYEMCNSMQHAACTGMEVNDCTGNDPSVGDGECTGNCVTYTDYGSLELGYCRARAQFWSKGTGEKLGKPVDAQYCREYNTNGWSGCDGPFTVNTDFGEFTLGASDYGTLYKASEVRQLNHYIGCKSSGHHHYRKPNVPATPDGVKRCREVCFTEGYDYFGFECPMGGTAEVHCQCYGSVESGYTVSDQKCKEYNAAGSHCSGPFLIPTEFGEFHMGAASYGSIYKTTPTANFYMVKDFTGCDHRLTTVNYNSGGYMGYAETAEDCAAMCKDAYPWVERFVWRKRLDKWCSCHFNACTMDYYPTSKYALYEFEPEGNHHVFNYPDCRPGCLTNDQQQLSGQIYKVSDQCYLAADNCWGCLEEPANYPGSLIPQRCSVYVEYPSCAPDCLRDGTHQKEDEIYKVSGKCYLSTNECMGCLDFPEEYPEQLSPITCSGAHGYPACKPNCLTDGTDQIEGEIYKVSGQCYLSMSNCRGCLDTVDPDDPDYNHLRPIGCSGVFEYSNCRPECLKNDRQIPDQIYRVSGQCYLALDDCSGCLSQPWNHPNRLAPIEC